nr:hypothetical protein [Tanacetum cinerariifolium]
MSSIKFAEKHNLVAFLEKPAESEGFEQIVDFLYVKIVNENVQIRAIIDGKKIIVTEASIRRDLQLEDAEGRMNEKEMFGVNDLDGDEVIVDATASKEVEQSKKLAKKEVSTADPVTTAEVARNLEAQMKAEMKEEERIAKEKDEADIVVIKQ